MAKFQKLGFDVNKVLCIIDYIGTYFIPVHTHCHLSVKQGRGMWRLKWFFGDQVHLVQIFGGFP